MATLSRNQPCPCGSGKKYKLCCADRRPLQTGTSRIRQQPQELLQEAIKHHQAGRLKQAKTLYLQVLQAAPDHPDTLHLLGLIHHQLGQNDEALPLIKRAVQQMPAAAHFVNNLGETYRALNRFDEAKACYEKALTLQPGNAEAHRNLGLVYLATGHPERAITHLHQGTERFPEYLGNYWALGLALSSQGRAKEALVQYDKILSRCPDDAPTLCAKGIALKADGDLEKTIQHYLHAISLQPAVAELHHNLALIYHGQGKVVEAQACFEKALELQPSNETARHLLAAIQNRTPERAPAAYVRDTFDGYADNFDTHLVDRLQYRTPKMLADLLQTKLDCEATSLNILDLGCGTGLFGEEIRHLKDRMTGVDLSTKMLDKARTRNIYDELIADDLLNYLASSTEHFDLIVATDVFNYVGNLQPVFEHASRLLRKGKWFAFSLEAAPEGVTDFALDKTGRYQHSRRYVLPLCERHGFEELSFSQSTIRMDGNKAVTGYLYHLRRKAE